MNASQVDEICIAFSQILVYPLCHVHNYVSKVLGLGASRLPKELFRRLPYKHPLSHEVASDISSLLLAWRTYDFIL